MFPIGLCISKCLHCYTKNQASRVTASLQSSLQDWKDGRLFPSHLRKEQDPDRSTWHLPIPGFNTYPSSGLSTLATRMRSGWGRLVCRVQLCAWQTTNPATVTMAHSLTILPSVFDGRCQFCRLIRFDGSSDFGQNVVKCSKKLRVFQVLSVNIIH